MKKILKAIVFTFLAIILLGMLWFAWASHANKTEHKSNPINYESKKEEAKKALLVYQKSRTSFSNNLAVSVAESLSENGYNVLMNYPGDYLSKDLSEYDLLIFQSPVYMATPSPVLTDYIKSIENYGDAKVIFYSTGMLDTTEEFASIEELFSNHPLDGLFKITQSEFKRDRNIAWSYIQEIIY